MYCWGAELPLAPIELSVTACRCGHGQAGQGGLLGVDELAEGGLVVGQLALERRRSRSRSADISCSTPASWLASVSSCFVCALRFPDSSISSDPCCSSTDGSPEVSTPAIEVAPVSSNAAAAVCGHVGLRRLELGVGVVQPHPHLGQPGLRGGQLLAGLVELLG